jgi:hypothetical protein
MATSYVTMGTLKYDFKWSSYKETETPSRSVAIGLSGATLIDSFSFTDYAYQLTALCKLTESRSGYGALADLRTLSAAGTFNFVSPLGGTITAIMANELNIPHVHSLADSAFPCEVNISLRKYQT